MQLTFDPNDSLQHIGEALALLLVAIAQHVDDPHGLLEAVQRAEQRCVEFPTMYAPQTRALVRYAHKGLEGALDADSARRQPN